MQCLSRTYIKTVLDKLLIFSKSRTFQYLITTIASIVKQNMSYVFHMNTYLMRASCFESALHHRYIPKPFYDLVVSHRRFTMLSIFKNRHLQTVFHTSPDISFYTAFILFDSPPYYSNILPFCSFIEKLG